MFNDPKVTNQADYVRSWPSMLVVAMLGCPSALCARNTSSHCAQALEMLRSCSMIQKSQIKLAE